MNLLEMRLINYSLDYSMNYQIMNNVIKTNGNLSNQFCIWSKYLRSGFVGLNILRQQIATDNAKAADQYKIQFGSHSGV